MREREWVRENAKEREKEREREWVRERATTSERQQERECERGSSLKRKGNKATHKKTQEQSIQAAMLHTSTRNAAFPFSVYVCVCA